jgi:replicative DNA helicase
MNQRAELPRNIDAEQKVLGAILLEPSAITRVADFLRSEHFYRDDHTNIYAAMLHLHRKRESIDVVMIEEELERADKLVSLEDMDYLFKLLDRTTTAYGIESHARIVEDKWKKRQLIRISGEIAGRAYQEDEDALTYAQNTIFKLAQGSDIKAVRNHREHLSDYIAQLSELHERTTRGIITGVPTGFKYIDKKLGGLRPSDLIILAARPGVGKTSLALNVGDHAVRTGRQVLMFSMEMAASQLMQRWMAMEARIDQTKLRDARISDEEWAEISKAAARLEELPGSMWVDDTCGLDWMAMRSRAMRQKAETGLDLIIVDYLQLGQVPEEDRRKANDRRLVVEEVSRQLKYMARDLGVPVLSLAQLSRAVEQRADKIEQLSDLRESGGIEADADIVMFIHKDKDIPKDAPVYDVSLIIEKHRNGATGIIPLRFIAAETRYETLQMTNEEMR